MVTNLIYIGTALEGGKEGRVGNWMQRVEEGGRQWSKACGRVKDLKVRRLFRFHKLAHRRL